MGVTFISSSLCCCRFFQQRLRLLLCTGNEQLNKDFTLVLRGGAFVLLASSIAVRREGAGPPADGAAAVAAGTEALAVAPTAPADGLQQAAAARRDSTPAAAAGPVPAADWGYSADQPPGSAGEAPGGLHATRSASADFCEAITFHVVGWQGLGVDPCGAGDFVLTGR